MANKYYLCSTFYAIAVVDEAEAKTTTYCMPPPQSDLQYDQGYAAATPCNYHEYIDPTRPTVSSTGKLAPPIAFCGFNQDPFFYCPILQGDLPFITVFNKFFKFMRTVNEQQLCHVSSSGFDWIDGENWGCWELRKKDSSKVWLAKEQLDWLRTGQGDRGFPNVANNADCIKTIMT